MKKQSLNSSDEELKRLQKWAETEIVEYKKFIQEIRKELRGRRK